MQIVARKQEDKKMNQEQQELTRREVEEEVKKFLEENPEIAQKIEDVMDGAVCRTYILVKFSEIREELKKQEKESQEERYYQQFIKKCSITIRVDMVTSILKNAELLLPIQSEHFEEEICKIINVYNFSKYIDDIQKSMLGAIKFGEAFGKNLEELLEE